MNPNTGEPLPATRGLPEPAMQANGDLERLRDDFRTFVADCQTLLRNAGTLSGEGATLARAELSKRMSDAQARLDSMRRTANDQAMRMRASTEDYVRREPLKAVGIAAAVGALVALLMAPSSRR
jgi:ElaB/YqjD/DUF883 family membrane-anchored ribosome-binding protein